MNFVEEWISEMEFTEEWICPPCNKKMILRANAMAIVGRYLPLHRAARLAQVSTTVNKTIQTTLSSDKSHVAKVLPSYQKKDFQQNILEQRVHKNGVNKMAELNVGSLLGALDPKTYGYWDDMNDAGKAGYKHEFESPTASPDFVLFGRPGDAFIVTWPESIVENSAADQACFLERINTIIKHIKEKWRHYGPRGFAVVNLSAIPGRHTTQAFLDAILKRKSEIGRGEIGNCKDNILYVYRRHRIMPVFFNDGDERSFKGNSQPAT
jgi:hypothetical protein